MFIKPYYKTMFVVFLFTNVAFSQNMPMGIFDGHTDVGKVKIPGTVKFSSESQEYIIQGSGKNMWFDQDEFHFLWKRLEGDFILRAGVKFVGEGVDAHRKMGWIIRSNFKGNSTHVNVSVHGDGLTSLQFRKIQGGITEEVKSTVKSPDVIQLERRDQTYIMSVASFGDSFTVEQISDVKLNNEVIVGLYVCSHNADVSERAIFNNVRIIIPAPQEFKPYTDYIGSNIETMDITTGLRMTHYSNPKSLQAPNWTPDGKSLIYNSEGLLYRFNLDTKSSKLIHTGIADKNNNDHVISFDGKYLGISHHPPEGNQGSIIYTIPIKGGVPKRITEKGPSYLHGWSPDGKSLIYTAMRNEQYDIYKIPSTGGKEIQLTKTKGLDDGSEYTPDGKFIYFNSNRTGTMQIWRMRPDGSKQEQITFDEYHDWFPHISPDGKKIVFLSFMKEVKSNDHPFYKHVYLRMISDKSKKPRVISYLYGGQGTINVPSWSPDSQKIAFISNTKFP